MSGYVGQRVPRVEDERLLRGRGTYVGDLRPAGLLEAAFARSRVPHAIVRRVDVSRARTVTGVAGAWAAADLVGLPDVPPTGDSAADRAWPSLARERVRFAGQTLAVVLGATRAAAEDGAEAIDVSLEPLPGLV